MKLRAGKYKVETQVTTDKNHIYFKFPFNKDLMAEIKSMENAHWCGYDDPPLKVWRVDITPHNLFRLKYLGGQNPYSKYDSKIIQHSYDRPLYQHQKVDADFLLTRKQAVLAAQPGVGKTLAVIEVMERSGFEDWWYVAPRSALKGVERELKLWDCKINPTLITYEGLTRKLENWCEDLMTPHGVVLDESSRAKNPTAKRSQAAYAIANGIRDDYGNEGYIILMSGTPAPKSPLDWWHQCRIACPGYIKEGSYAKFRNRLCLVKQQDGPFGQAYPQIITWWDNEEKCAICGLTKEQHNLINMEDDVHAFKSSVNEVAYLYKRMEGLVLVQLKKDCLDLPDKIYRPIYLEPTKSTVDIAKAILASANTVIAGLTLLRELSDGFQYIQEPSGEETCSVCGGSGRIKNLLLESNLPEDSKPEEMDLAETVTCDGCGGKGRKKTYTRVTKQVDTPKEAALKDLLDEYMEVGRVVIYGGFTGSIDRIVQICKENGWNWIRVDGRGWHSDLEGDPLDNFQDNLEKYPRIAFIGQPGAAGMGLTLTASPVVIYYSNDFNNESREQSEDRCHRAGMDTNRGCTIIDLIHLPTDELVIENLKKKQELQSLTMGQVQNAFK